jgi:O-methyltransferase
MTVQTSSEPHPGLAAARPARAAGPGPEAAAQRRAYLDLLKLSLCDLVGASTTSVGRTEDGLVMARELSGDQLRLRAAGMDWPLHGLTMAGLARLDDLQACVESIVADGVAGDLIEAGSWRGGSSIVMRATLDALGAGGRTVYVADSFQGFPAGAAGDDLADGERDDLAVFDFLSVPVDEVRESFARLGLDEGVTFVPGFFEETMDGLRGQRWALVRLDGDTYEATRLTLDALYPGLAQGGYCVVDDYGALDECRRAVEEFRGEHGITEPLEQVDWTCVRWRRESDPEVATGSRPAPASGEPPRAVERRAARHVPTVRELELERELAELRVRLQRTAADLQRLEGSPLAAARAWLGRKLGRRGAGR